MKQEKLFDLLKAAVSPCECVKAAKQELLENGFEEIACARWQVCLKSP